VCRRDETDPTFPLRLVLHGFPCSSYDWRSTLASMGEASTLALDFLGFGLSEANIVERRLADESRPVVVVAHDMGTSIATESRSRASRLTGVSVVARSAFGTTGVLRRSNLVMWDTATLTWRQQFNGLALVGRPAGERLRMLPVETVSWSEFQRRYPHGDVLAEATGFARQYGLNPYAGYDAGRSLRLQRAQRRPAPASARARAGRAGRRIDARCALRTVVPQSSGRSRAGCCGRSFRARGSGLR
jgi:pimeloyl-ACP methyl ester carboxylesterase